MSNEKKASPETEGRESGCEQQAAESAQSADAAPQPETAGVAGVSAEQAANGVAEAASATDGAEAAADASQEAAEPDPLRQELERLRREADEHYQRFLRTQVDFDNFRKRTRQEKEELIKYASQKLVERLLPVVDNMERALAVSAQNKDHDALAKGVEMIFRQLEQVLREEGVEPLEAVGQPFNPELHQAIMQVESDEHGEGIVVEEVQKGYRMKDKVLRPALVKVSK